VSEKLDEAQALLREILRRSGMSADVKATDEGERMVLEVVGEDVGRVIGKQGAMLDALQYIVNKAMYRDVPGQKPIVVDAEGYRERRAESLVDLAKRLAEKAIKTNQTVPVSPMSAHDRRIMHLAVSEMAGVISRSEGEGAMRRMLIVPDASKVAGAPPSPPPPRSAPKPD
jgi:spoIIIJ-associated protein